MRTNSEIKNRIKQIKSRDIFGSETNILLLALTFDDAKSFLASSNKNIEKIKQFWDQNRIINPITEIRKYLDFAWFKANSYRILSCKHLINQFQALMWLAGVNSFDNVVDSEFFACSKPLLVIISEFLGVNWRELDDGYWMYENDQTNTTPTNEEILRLIGVAETLKSEFQQNNENWMDLFIENT